MVNGEEITALNDLLKGLYMGIHAYERFLVKIRDASVKQQFQTIQQGIKSQAQDVAKRIQDLNGIPVDSEGMIGAIQGYISSLQIPDDVDGIVEKAIKGETLGVEMAEKVVRGNLSSASFELVRHVLDQDREHVKQLKSISSAKVQS
ncbi:PA2169 family four-helix-bundle protein [Sporolactobacillus sp. CPB3-1]|uniref:PA2169 family four-helix-bundle protein n=1 Tax=Sporolactobacillus mangiferae TaxID=2940498 RepID=A0ABT0MA41_9BACL|nr:DUF2383 domain-containing protein [Sporolactobacillus mangiferae]MCL1631523.1 PA2169 family four-helix-bundle protein [Sporolactobacillus mangiferae]